MWLWLQTVSSLERVVVYSEVPLYWQLICSSCAAVPVPVEASGSEDRPEDYIPDVVKQYLAYFRAMVAQKNMAAILQLYEYESVVVVGRV